VPKQFPTTSTSTTTVVAVIAFASVTDVIIKQPYHHPSPSIALPAVVDHFRPFLSSHPSPRSSPYFAGS